MKKRPFALLLTCFLIFSLVACKSSANISDDFQEIGEDAVKIGEDYLDKYYTQDEAYEKLGELNDKIYLIRELRESSGEEITDEEQLIDTGVFLLSLSIKNNDPSSDVKESIKSIKKWI
ncbi:hypothetical protein M2454_002893 [Aequitasia blattaphilus]|uniref:Uncharacterized protein n=1 Tax=Aequitasia blattaphilus TaxID=2949332 RepID=A0ABT1ECI7_9FIRM|nr:hypothetical protein [Aequitasia blattaphilus]MCP1103558.1 hypothetical protein [Aequitasia blattaphilus]MCR8616198.1 hypothetical protein [Aequitasia blattaphilus]